MPVCKQCGQPFDKHTDLMNHIRVKHKKTTPPPENAEEREGDGAEDDGRKEGRMSPLVGQEQFKSLLERWGVKEAESSLSMWPVKAKGSSRSQTGWRRPFGFSLHPAPFTITRQGRDELVQAAP